MLYFQCIYLKIVIGTLVLKNQEQKSLLRTFFPYKINGTNLGIFKIANLLPNELQNYLH
jgi:hypothetical protein